MYSFKRLISFYGANAKQKKKQQRCDVFYNSLVRIPAQKINGNY